MDFDMTKCLECFSLALDFAEVNYLHVNLNHSRRVAYVALNIGKVMELDEDNMKDLLAFSLLHDNGITYAGLSNKEYEFMPEHCIEGEKNISVFPVFKKRENVIKFHHEHHNGTGIFGVSGDDVPFFSQIIHLPDVLDTQLSLHRLEYTKREEVIEYAKRYKGRFFSPYIVDAFMSLIEKERFWIDLYFFNISEVLNRIVPKIILDYTWEDIIPISETFMKIIDSKSKFTHSHSRGITDKMDIMSDYYNFDSDKKLKLHIAANLHDLGKLYVPNKILDKPSKLDHLEFSNGIKKHTYFTKLALEKIPGFEDISNWAGNHHEKLNGKGYPEGLLAKDLDRESRILTTIDIYQALTEERPYRKGSSHGEAMSIIYNMCDNGFLDRKIAKDVDDVLYESKFK